MAKPAIRTRHDRRAAKAEVEAAAEPTAAASVAPTPAGFAEILHGDIAPDALNPRKQAQAGVAAFLRQEETEYGDAAYDWGPDGVENLARGIRVDGFGQQVDLEEAIEATAEIELTPALQRLAGVASAEAR